MSAFEKLIALAAATLTLSACSLLVSKREDLTVFAPALVLPAPALPAHAARAWQLVVAEPQAIEPLNGARIVVLPQPGMIQFYKGVRWRDGAPLLIQELLLQSFQDSANLAGVGSPATGLHADFVLYSNLQEFQAEYRGAQVPTVTLRINAQFVDNSTHRSLATHTFTGAQPCTDTSLPSVFAAFQEALNRVLPQIVEWSNENGDANWRASSRATVR